MHTTLTKKVEDIIERRAGELSLVTDGWTNIRNESIINYTLVSRRDAIFIKSVHTHVNRHTGQYIAEGLQEVIAEIGPEKLVAVTTDNASNMTSSWEFLKSTYPQITYLGCGSHMINLLVEDITKLPTFSTHFELLKGINKWWKSSSILGDHLRSIAILHGCKPVELQLPGRTRWQGRLYTCRSIFKNKSFMMQAILDRKTCLGEYPRKDVVEKYESIRTTLLDENFWTKTADMVTLLEPYLKLTIAMESNQSKLSRLFAWFSWLIAETVSMRSVFITSEEARNLITARFLKIYNPLWLIAYLCDPITRYERSVNITSTSMNALGPFLQQWFRVRGETTDTVASLVLGQLRELQNREGDFTDELNWQSARSMKDITVWWKSCFSDTKPHLYQLAVFALSISPTSGAAERNWSAFGFIHCQKRNRLSTERVDKLVYMYWNLRMFRGIPDYGPLPSLDRDKDDMVQEDHGQGDYGQEDHDEGDHDDETEEGGFQPDLNERVHIELPIEASTRDD
jgi:hypothetical protein